MELDKDLAEFVLKKINELYNGLGIVLPDSHTMDDTFYRYGLNTFQPIAIASVTFVDKKKHHTRKKRIHFAVPSRSMR